jgi:arginine utilization protein RocB
MGVKMGDLRAQKLHLGRKVSLRERILKTLKELVALPSVSATDQEKIAAQYLETRISNMEYFHKHPEHFGSYSIPNDPYDRSVVFALVKGSASGSTVILMGHYDVVDTQEYGVMRDMAYDIENLPLALKNAQINDSAREDLDSGEWIFGRGVADMKGGLAIHLSVLEQYSENPNGGAILFLAVPDEESYSAGMRHAVQLLLELREKHSLSYELLINTEPTRMVKEKQVVPIGTGGKCLPVVLVQGKKAHVAACFDGLNPIGILSEIFLETELSASFSDEFSGEVTTPPTWANLRDMKDEYDVSVPQFASGYLSVLSLTSTPGEILAKLGAISKLAFQRYMDRVKVHFEEYQEKCGKVEGNPEIEYEPEVLYFEQLRDKCALQSGFESFLEELFTKTETQVRTGKWNYPQATIQMMKQMLEFSRITTPVVILGFSPPYYPAMCSSNLQGKEEKIGEYFDVIQKESETVFHRGLVKENYTVALSDCSYAASDKPFLGSQFVENTPLWERMYSIDFDGIAQLNIPCMILGPHGKEYHQMTERVERLDLTERIPHLIATLCNTIFRMESFHV